MTKRVKGSVLPKEKSEKEKRSLSHHGTNPCRKNDGSIQSED